jgi:glycine/D-amino acid oxidase-like deaminating enzyme
MRLLFGYEDGDNVDLAHPGSNVAVRDIALEGFDAATCAYLRRLDPDCVVLRPPHDDVGVVHSWVRGMREAQGLKHGVHLICLVRDLESNPASHARPRDDYHLHVIPVPRSESGERLALRRAESIASNQTRTWLSCLPRVPRRRVLLIGCGIVNLVTAVHLVHAGYEVSILESGPDPGTPTSLPRCSWSGGDGRIFSFNEARHHLRGRAPHVAARAFQRLITEGGWLCTRPERLTSADQRWIERYDQTAAWLRDVYNDDIVAMNRESASGWDALQEAAPSLFADVGFQRPLFRVYPDAERFARAEREERGIGAFKRRLERVTAELPSLGRAVDDGKVFAAIEVEGFGLNIHRFARAVLAYLEARGVTVHFDTPAERVALDALGNVEGVWSGSRFFAADHYVASPGVGGAQFLGGSASAPQLAAMLGVWVSIPRPGDAAVPPMKVSRDGFASDESAAGANVIPGYAADGSPVLHISAGHGFLGENATSADEGETEAMFRAVEETASSLFPDWFHAARESGRLVASRSRCIRPWTPTCLGLFETRPTSEGGVFAIAGGHNTGGFAQSPQVAQAVLAALDGRAHPMHRLYHPERLETFLEPSLRPAVRLDRAS